MRPIHVKFAKWAYDADDRTRYGITVWIWRLGVSLTWTWDREGIGSGRIWG